MTSESFPETTAELSIDFAPLFENRLDKRSFQSGEVILAAGEKNRSLHVILEGEVEIKAGNFRVASEGRGGIFGELSLIDDSPTSASVIACSDGVCAVLDQLEFVDLIQDHPFFAIAVMRVICSRLRAMN
ncbi:MAG: cyclic nucleotide-binding domain-containing protein [Verrucomicrobiota bacterium]